MTCAIIATIDITSDIIDHLENKELFISSTEPDTFYLGIIPFYYMLDVSYVGNLINITQSDNFGKIWTGVLDVTLFHCLKADNQHMT
jgi:hypothetical protein